MKFERPENFYYYININFTKLQLERFGYNLIIRLGGIMRIHHKIKHHITRIRHIKPRTPEMFEFLSDPMIAALFLVFGLVALDLSLISFLEALYY